jgi:alkylation response protein AidB-like acyl-CoA dehydrogenase
VHDAVSIGACSIGAAATCFNLAREHVKTRKQVRTNNACHPVALKYTRYLYFVQFGRPLAANQSISFTLANMATDLQVRSWGCAHIVLILASIAGFSFNDSTSC